MFGSLKKLSKKVFRENKTGRFVTNITGEVIMVVVGILIALAIDNWNNERKDRAKLRQIYSVLIDDMVNDTTDIAELVENYEGMQELYVKLLLKRLTKEELRACDSCHSILTDYQHINIEKRGYESLAAINPTMGADSTNVEILLFYGYYFKLLDRFEEDMANNIKENIAHWRDNYDWYADLYLNEYPDEYLNYLLTNPEFKNRLTYNYSLVYDQYVPLLSMMSEAFAEIMEELQGKVNGP